VTDLIDMRPTARAAQPAVTAPPMSDLEALADELAPVNAGTVTLLVDSRPGWGVTYSLGIDGPQLAGWRRANKDDTIPSGVDEFGWQRTILAAQCTGMVRQGAAVLDPQGRPVTFTSPELWRLLGVPAGSPSGATEAVRRFYANDFAVTSAADKVLSAAGFGKAAVEAGNPTSGSSGA
jgi:hypothetical protein